MQLVAQPHLRISLRITEQGTERNKNRATPWPDRTNALWAVFFWRRLAQTRLPQEAATVPSVEFFFLFSYFHCVVGVKAVAFGSYFPSAYCYALVEGICFLSGETQRRCPCLQE